MADNGLVEESVYNQIKAIEGWALLAYQESVKKRPNIELILENLRKINLQTRKAFRDRSIEDNFEEKLSQEIKRRRGLIEKIVSESLDPPKTTNPNYNRLKYNYDNILERKMRDYEIHVLEPFKEREMVKFRVMISDLKRKLTQLRAAVVTLRDIKKDKELSNASKRTLRMLSSLATETLKFKDSQIIFTKGWINFDGRYWVDYVKRYNKKLSSSDDF